MGVIPCEGGNLTSLHKLDNLIDIHIAKTFHVEDGDAVIVETQDRLNDGALALAGGPDVTNEPPVNFLGAAGRHVRSDSAEVLHGPLHTSVEATQSRKVEPDDSIGSGDSDEQCAGVIAFYDPAFACDKLFDLVHPLRYRRLHPAGVPEVAVEVNDLKAKPLTEFPRKGRSTGTRAAEDQDAAQLRIISLFFSANVAHFGV